MGISYCKDLSRLPAKARAQKVEGNEGLPKNAAVAGATSSAIKVIRGEDPDSPVEYLDEVGGGSAPAPNNDDKAVYVRHPPEELLKRGIKEDPAALSRVPDRVKTAEDVQKAQERKQEERSEEHIRPAPAPEPAPVKAAPRAASKPEGGERKTTNFVGRHPAAKPLEKVRLAISSPTMGKVRTTALYVSVSPSIVAIIYSGEDESNIFEPPALGKENPITVEYDGNSYECWCFGFSSEVNIPAFGNAPALLVVLPRCPE